MHSRNRDSWVTFLHQASWTSVQCYRNPVRSPCLPLSSFLAPLRFLLEEG